jgi:hypothetical protein
MRRDEARGLDVACEAPGRFSRGQIAQEEALEALLAAFDLAFPVPNGLTCKPDGQSVGNRLFHHARILSATRKLLSRCTVWVAVDRSISEPHLVP